MSSFQPYCGAVCSSLSILMAIRLFFPETSLVDLGFIKLKSGLKIRQKHIALSFAVLTIVCSCFTNTSFFACRSAVVVGSAFLTSWIYLRFYSVNPHTKSIGDTSEDFALASFFPWFLQPLLKIPSKLCLVCCLSLGFCKKYQSKHSSMSMESVLIGGEEADPVAERRKALAMKMINDKLAEKAVDVGK